MLLWIHNDYLTRNSHNGLLASQLDQYLLAVKTNARGDTLVIEGGIYIYL